MSHVVITTLRNEGAFLLEWLAHHRACGFTDFQVISNNCADGSDQMLERLAELGWLSHHPNPGPYDDRGIQFTALKTAAKLDIVQKADWILPLDIDEFVNIHTGDRTVSALLAALPEASAITLTWRLFGYNDLVRYRVALVGETFTACAPEIMHWPWRAAMFKTLYRNDGTYRALGVHRPRQPVRARLDTAKWYDGEGRVLDAQFKTRRLFSNYGQKMYGLAQLNHYPLGAMESFVLKADRGRAVHSDQMLDIDYWVERNFNMDRETSLQPLIDRAAPQPAGHRSAGVAL